MIRKMRELFEKIESCNPNHQNLVLSIVKDGRPSEKALISNHELVWESNEQGFFSGHREVVCDIEESGLVEIDGMQVFCELLGQEKKLVICGGGHVAIPVVQMGRMIGCFVTVLEDRPKFADNARRAGADQVICAPFEQSLEGIRGDDDTYFIIVTRGHRYDQICLERIAEKSHAYIGMIGSRRRTSKLKEVLLEKGVSKEILDQVYTPIGLNIGAETPEEIAVAIMAEIIEVKNGRKKNFGYSREMMQVLLDPEHRDEKMLLSTIISRRGSAPRGVGSRMLVLPDGNTVGTVGGGCAESRILQKALLMFHENDRNVHVFRADMSGQDAEEDGMVCGGVIEVMLEMI